MKGIGLFLLDKVLALFKPLFKKGKKVKIYLIIDRHEWHYGKKANNLLVVCVYLPFIRIGFPVQVLDLDRKGSSSFKERELVIEEIYRKLRGYIDNELVEVEVLGDREFIGEKWEDYIGSKFGRYIIRVKKDYEVRDGKKVKDIFREMSKGEVRDIRRDGWRVVIKKLKEVEGRRDACLALVTLDMESKAEDIVERYKDRWKIERMFLNLESNGFRLGETHLKDSSKIEMLFYILSICLLFIRDSGEDKGVRGRRRQEEYIFKGIQSDQEGAKGDIS